MTKPFHSASSKALSTLFLSTLLLALLSPLAHAFSLDQCTVSLGGLLADVGLNQCLPMSSLSRLLTEDITPALVNSTATDFCAYPDCSQQTIALVQNTVVQNCLDGENMPNDTTTAEMVYGVASLYPPLKQGLCTRIPDNGTFCLTELAQSLGDYVRANPSPLGLQIFFDEAVLLDYVSKVPKEIICTDCNKAIINPLSSYVDKNMLSLRPEIVAWAQAAKKASALKCGNDFVDGKAPNLGSNNKGGASGDQDKSAAGSLVQGHLSLRNTLAALLLVALAMLPM